MRRTRLNHKLHSAKITVRNSIFGFGLLVNDSQGLLGALVYVPKLANA
jgi:hypothetical protein